MKFLILSVLVISTMMVSIEARHGANLTGALAELESVSEEKNHNYGRKLRQRVNLRTPLPAVMVSTQRAPPAATTTTTATTTASTKPSVPTTTTTTATVSVTKPTACNIV